MYHSSQYSGHIHFPLLVALGVPVYFQNWDSPPPLPSKVFGLKKCENWGKCESAPQQRCFWSKNPVCFAFPLAAEALFVKAVFRFGADPEHQKVPRVWKRRVLPTSALKSCPHLSERLELANSACKNAMAGRLPSRAGWCPELGGEMPAVAAGGQCLPGRSGPGAGALAPCPPGAGSSRGMRRPRSHHHHSPSVTFTGTAHMQMVSAHLPAGRRWVKIAIHRPEKAPSAFPLADLSPAGTDAAAPWIWMCFRTHRSAPAALSKPL